MTKALSLSLGILVPVLAGLSGCMAGRAEVCSATPPTPAERGVVFSVDGAGGFRATSAALSQAVVRECLPLRVEAVDWSHGWGRVYADQTDYVHARCEGARLAGQIAAYRQAHPAGEIYLVGHSAGCAVALAAMEVLPPCSVDRVVLLAPALSAEYNLRPALRGVRYGLDVYCSERDWFYLGLGTSIFGTSDRRWSPASGRVGFCTDITSPEDLALYSKLHQHPWHPCLAWTGNLGGHYGGYQPEFLQLYVLPLLQRNANPCTACSLMAKRENLMHPSGL